MPDVTALSLLLLPARQALLWCGLVMVLTGVLWMVIAVTHVTRQRQIFRHPPFTGRLLRGDVSLWCGMGLVMVWLMLAGGFSEWLRGFTPSLPGALLQAGVLLVAVVVLVNTVRHACAFCGARLLCSVLAALMLLRLIWIFT
ncbi:hypothetical protein IOW38_004126 [Salmonella enterica]|nr:hypothetical protein [Salmonella enterica]EGM2645626.1 hypothetical protein [Salmonella enterica]EGM2983565.1 hypothetical protein [Salmonella enterica]EJU6033237.1 hypothetical protein [Salmonella enterica]